MKMVNCDRVGFDLRRRNSGRSAWVIVVATVVGATGAMVPTAYLDEGTGAGVLGGACYGIVAMGVLTPLLMPFIVANELASEQELELLRCLYLADVDTLGIQVGAIASAARRWGVLITYAAGAGAFVGLGDGLQGGDILGVDHVAPRGMAVALATTIYVAAMAIALTLTLRSVLLPVTVTVGCTLLPFSLGPYASELVVRYPLAASPLAPLINMAGPEAIGRFALQLDPNGMLVVAICWFAVSCFVISNALLRGTAPL